MKLLVIANRTAATHRLLDEIRRHAPCDVALLIPPTRRPDWTPETARDIVSRAARRPATLVDSLDGDYDAAIVSTRSKRLTRRARHLGVPATVVAVRKPRLGMRQTAEMSLMADASLTAALPPRSDDLPR
jgi:hypothetical protein